MSLPSGRESKSSLYSRLYGELSEKLRAENDLVANAANTAALLFHALPDVNWVGFYFLRGGELVLGPFQGKAATTRILMGRGVCGTAATTQETVVVGDVHQFEGHIVCDASSKSEIVVPLINWGKLVGVLDIDSPIASRFDDEDVEGLEALASVFLSSHTSDDLPDLRAESRTAEAASL